MDSIYIILFYSFRTLIKFTPNFILKPILKFLAFLVYKIDKKHHKIAKVNLDLAYEDNLSDLKKEEIIKGTYRSLVFTMADFIRNQGASKEELLSKVTFFNDDVIKKALKEKRKIIIITAHYSNWELLSLSIAAKYTPMAIVGRDLESISMNKILTKNREQFDIELLSKTGAMKGMVKALKNNRPIGILVDQNTKEEEGVLIDFFDKKARHTPSVAILAKKFNAVIIPAYIKTDDYSNYEARFYEPIEIEDSDDKEQDILNCVQAQANITQKIIEEKPDEWFWLHQRWKNQYESMYK